MTDRALRRSRVCCRVKRSRIAAAKANISTLRRVEALHATRFPERWRRGSSLAHSGESHVRESYRAQRRLTVRVALLVTPPWDALIVATIFRPPLVVAIYSERGR